MKVMEYNWDKIWWFKLIIRLWNTVQTIELVALESSQSRLYCGFVVFFMTLIFLDILENTCKTRYKSLKTVFRIILIFVVLVLTPIYLNYSLLTFILHSFSVDCMHFIFISQCTEALMRVNSQGEEVTNSAFISFCIHLCLYAKSFIH